MIECIIFDMDGTLVDSERLMIRGMSELIEEITISDEELIRRFGGQHLSQTFMQLEQEFGCTLPPNFEASYRSRVAELIDRELEAFDGVHEALSLLNIPICLATNAPLQKVEQVLKTTELGEYFGDRLFSAYQIGAWKPEPDLFLHAAENMYAKPENCLVVEDSIFGIQAGLAAGMQVLQYCGAHAEPLHQNYFRQYSELQSLVNAGQHLSSQY